MFDGTNQYILPKLDKIHYRAALIVSGAIHGSSCQKVLACLGWMSLANHRREKNDFNV
jgi:hypothetical protein